MYSATTYIIRPARHEDAAALAALDELDSARPIGPAELIGEIDGRPAAAISLVDGRVVADPFQRTGPLASILRLRLNALRAQQRQPSLRERIRSAIVVRTAPAAA